MVRCNGMSNSASRPGAPLVGHTGGLKQTMHKITIQKCSPGTLLQTANCNKEHARRAGKKREEEEGRRSTSRVRGRAEVAMARKGGQWRQVCGHRRVHGHANEGNMVMW